MEYDNERLTKCKTQFQNIRISLIEGKNAENIFRELMDTKKCDHIYSFENIRNVAFKKLNSQIKEKLEPQNSIEEAKDLTSKEIKTVERECQRLQEFLRRSIAFNIRESDKFLEKVSPLKYYSEVYDWNPVAVKFLLAERFFSFFRFLVRK